MVRVKISRGSLALGAFFRVEIGPFFLGATTSRSTLTRGQEVGRTPPQRRSRMRWTTLTRLGRVVSCQEVPRA